MISVQIVAMLLLSRSVVTNSFVRFAVPPSQAWTFQDRSVSSKVKQLPEKTLYVLDGTSMLYFGYHGLMGMRKYYDEEEWAQQPPVNTLTVMANQFAKFVVDVRPNYLAVAMDCGKKTFRNSLFPKYKEGRPEVSRCCGDFVITNCKLKCMLLHVQTPTELVSHFPFVQPTFEALGVPCFSSEGYEADDVMASLGKWANEKYCYGVTFEYLTLITSYSFLTEDFMSCTCLLTKICFS